MLRIFGARHAVAVSSGTAALHAAVFAAGLGPGDEAVTTPLTFVATSNAVLYQGARPVFADVRPDTLTLDPAAAAAALTPRTRALMPVHFAGQACDVDEWERLARARGLVLIQDAAHALGAEVHGRRVGGGSGLTVFSLHPVKHITTGEGGVVTTDDAGLAERMQRFRNHGLATDAVQGRAQVALHVDGQSFERGDVEDAAAVFGVFRGRRGQEPVERDGRFDVLSR